MGRRQLHESARPFPKPYESIFCGIETFIDSYQVVANHLAQPIRHPVLPVCHTLVYCFKYAMRSRRSSALGTLKLMLLSGTITSGSLNHFSSVASFHVAPEFFKPAE
jgi:hypothetical protein